MNDLALGVAVWVAMSFPFGVAIVVVPCAMYGGSE